MENCKQSHNKSVCTFPRCTFFTWLWLAINVIHSTVDNLALPVMLGDVEAGAASLNLTAGIDCLADSRPVSCETLSFPSSTFFPHLDLLSYLLSLFMSPFSVSCPSSYRLPSYVSWHSVAFCRGERSDTAPYRTVAHGHWLFFGSDGVVRAIKWDKLSLKASGSFTMCLDDIISVRQR